MPVVMMFFRWLFVPHNVVATDAYPKVLFKLGKWGIGYNSKPFRSYWPNGPSIPAYQYHNLLKHKLVWFKCKACSVGCWGYGQQDYCGSWVCYKRVYEN